jgi:ornithine cyclodeaminase/alanine dehydrogenase-like protein (mu-crystallin family)
MARTHLDAYMCVRNIRKVQVFSPTKANREAYAAEMSAKYDIEVVPCSNPEDAYRGADIISGCTDSAVPVLVADLIEPGQHIVNVGGGGGVPVKDVLDKVDVYFRFGNAPAPQGLPELDLADEYLTYAARPDHDYGFKQKRKNGRAHGVAIPDRVIYFEDILSGTNRGRASSDQITYSERGNLQGNQFHAVAGRAFERARDAGIGNEVPTDWFLQDIRD